MAETWWTWGQAVSYVPAHYPCDSPSAAGWMIEDMLEYGLLTARYEGADGAITPIEPQEWERSRDDPYNLYWRPPREEAPVTRDAVLGDASLYAGGASWIDYEHDERLGAPRPLASIRHSIRFDAAPLIQLCARQSPPAPQNGGGRPPRTIVSRLLVLAGMWIDEHGIPVAGSGEQAALERFLGEQAGDQIRAESRIREIAVQAIGIADAYRRGA